MHFIFILLRLFNCDDSYTDIQCRKEYTRKKNIATYFKRQRDKNAAFLTAHDRFHQTLHRKKNQRWARINKNE